jgi:hypothetical protein
MVLANAVFLTAGWWLAVRTHRLRARGARNG